MSWQKLSPKDGADGPRITARVSVSVKGVRSLQLFFNTAALNLLPGEINVDAWLGENGSEEDGRLKVAATRSGAFTLTKAARGSMRLTLPFPATSPQQSTTAEPCKIITVGQGEIELSLPTATWAPKPRGVASNSGRSLAAAQTAPIKPMEHGVAPAVAKEIVAPKGQPFTASNPLHAIQYLQANNVRAKRLENNRYDVDGREQTKGQVVKLINSFREMTGREALPPEAIR